MMAEMGVLALPLMLWIIFGVVRKGFRSQDGIVLGSAVGILRLALHGLVDFNFHITANVLTCSLLAGFIMRNRGGE
jgi:xanthine/uracil permease